MLSRFTINGIYWLLFISLLHVHLPKNILEETTILLMANETIKEWWYTQDNLVDILTKYFLENFESAPVIRIIENKMKLLSMLTNYND